ncbi:MAG: long-chain fatty acid--CoA ligase [Thermoleophilia bacterium]|nr:long-chain fatty acid--CoA ligase [Thermoleophilia bacterium]
MGSRTARRPREDHGFFGPDSVTWRVWTAPTAMLGFQRAVTFEALDPHLSAAVNDMRGVYTNPARRFERTAQYFLTIIMGDGRSAVEASRMLMRIHDQVTGTDPVTGRTYSANDPDSQLWIHVTAWHSILYCYERFGPGPLTAAEETQYWHDCAVAAELQPINVEDVPRSRDEVRAYFARVRPALALGEGGRRLFFYLLRPGYNPRARYLSLLWTVSSWTIVATMPRWIRRLAGLRQGRALDALATAVTRVVVRPWYRLDRVLFIMERFAPAAGVVIRDAMVGPAPLEARTVTPTEARERLDGPGGDTLPDTAVS